MIFFLYNKWKFYNKIPHNALVCAPFFFTMESPQRLSRFAAHNLHLISCSDVRRLPQTQSRVCLRHLSGAPWRDAAFLGHGKPFKCKDWAGGKLSAARLLSRAFMWKLRWSSEALFRIISWSERARKRHRASAWHFSTPGSDTCTYHTYISQRGRLVQEECLWKGGDDEQAPDHGGL